MAYHTTARDRTNEPVSFSDALDGHTVTATRSWLFCRIPAEVLRSITLHLAEDDSSRKGSLRGLALASSDCRQLARSCQFRTLRLDIGARSVRLMAFLLHEAAERLVSGCTPRPSISACVRQVKVGMVNFHPLRPRPPDVPVEDLEDVRERYEIFSDQLAFLLRPGVLPNLEHFDTGPRFWAVRQPFLNCFVHTRIRHLHLRGAAGISDPLQIPKCSIGWSWAAPWTTLETVEVLEVDITWDSTTGQEYGGDEACFIADLLYFCSRSLRVLHWNSPPLTIGEGPLDLIRHLIALPCLEVLAVNRRALSDANFLGSLLSNASNLRALIVDSQDALLRPETAQSYFLSLIAVSQIPSVTESLPLNIHGSLALNPRLQGLCFNGLVDTQLATQNLLPFLAYSFRHLTSLSLTFDRNRVPDATLKQVGQIRTLKILHFSARALQNPPGSDLVPPWLIKHGAILLHLGPLRNTIERFAVHDDDYRLPVDLRHALQRGLPTEHGTKRAVLRPRFTYRSLDRDLRADQTIEPPWYWAGYVRKGHARRIQRHADSYAAAFPRLRSLFVGGMHFAISAASDGDGRGDIQSLAHRCAIYERSSHDFSPVEELFGVSLNTAEIVEDETALGVKRYPTHPSRVYPPLRDYDDETEEEEAVLCESGDHYSEEDYDSLSEASSRTLSAGGFDTDDDYDEEEDEDDDAESQVPLARFFCEDCFLARYEGLGGGGKCPVVVPVVHTRCAHRPSAPSAAYLALMAARSPSSSPVQSLPTSFGEEQQVSSNEGGGNDLVPRSQSPSPSSQSSCSRSPSSFPSSWKSEEDGDPWK